MLACEFALSPSCGSGSSDFVGRKTGPRHRSFEISCGAISLNMSLKSKLRPMIGSRGESFRCDTDGHMRNTTCEIGEGFMDTLTPRERSIRMSLIRSTDTKPELRVRKLLYRLGYRYRLHRRDLPGKPDLVFPGRSKVLFVHGCFWHAHDGCKVANKPKTRSEFWNKKFLRNVARDKRNIGQLRGQGWHVYVVWECETRDATFLEARLARFLGHPLVTAKSKKYATERKADEQASQG